jgi:hypothetical protein
MIELRRSLQDQRKALTDGATPENAKRAIEMLRVKCLMVESGGSDENWKREVNELNQRAAVALHEIAENAVTALAFVERERPGFLAGIAAHRERWPVLLGTHPDDLAAIVGRKRGKRGGGTPSMFERLALGSEVPVSLTRSRKSVDRNTASVRAIEFGLTVIGGPTLDAGNAQRQFEAIVAKLDWAGLLAPRFWPELWNPSANVRMPLSATTQEAKDRVIRRAVLSDLAKTFERLTGHQVSIRNIRTNRL